MRRWSENRIPVPREPALPRLDMFKLPNPPSPQAESHELADFAELLAWELGTTSVREVAAVLGRLDENQNNVGCEDDSDELASELDEVMNEIERRQSACGRGYPFALDLEGTVLRHGNDDQDARSHIYRYLLLSTRLNMQSHRVHADIDGTVLLEELAAHVLRCYLGLTRARALVFGTASAGKFEAKVNNLCDELGEGGKFRALDSGSVDANDDKLDAVAWVPFSDRCKGQLVIFGQCKTGTNWNDQITHLQPGGFIKRWMREPFLLDPLRAFCVSEAMDRSRWCGASIYAGLIFDRCRIVDFCDDLGSDVLSRIKTWTAAARGTAFPAGTTQPARNPKGARVQG